MKTWLRWALIITQVGGGFAGIVITLDYLYNSQDTPLPLIVMSMGFMAIYTFVTVAGVLYALNEHKIRPLRMALWLQIPWISSTIIAWRFVAGFSFALTLFDGRLNLVYWLGSFWQFSIFEEQPAGIGINLFAVLMLYLLRRVRYSQPNIQPTLAEQVNSILQSHLMNTSLAGRDIQLQSLPEGKLSIKVGSGQYRSVDEVPEEEIRLAIRSAIADWENKGAETATTGGGWPGGGGTS